MALSAEQAALARRLGHDFAEPTLLQQALTHPSMASPVRPHNQRLEFLGDRVLNLAIAEALFAADAGAAEGELAIRYNELVRKETCAEIARDIGLGDVLRLSRGERLTSGRRKITTLGDALEAVIAAIYLDAGFARAREVVLRLWGDRVHEVRGQTRDPKTALQEWAQARRQPPPAYREVAREGPDHAPVFTVEVALESGETARAAASAKRVAEQAAAEALLARLDGDKP